MPKRRSRVTLQQVADEVGVSAKTVSNAFGRPDQLSAGLRDRVLATAARLGYPGPDPLAAGLRRGRVGALGVAYANGLAYAFEDPVSVALLGGLTRVAERAGSGLLLIPGSGDGVGAVRAAVVDGLVASSLSDDDPVLLAALGLGLPLVVLDQPASARLPAGVPWIGIDDRAAARGLAAHVLGRGHRRLGIVTFGLRRNPPRGPAGLAEQGRATYHVSRERLRGLRDAVEAAGLAWSAVPVWQGTDSTPREGAAGAAALLGADPPPTALLCLSDRLAEGALEAVRDAGATVAVTGFDDAPTAAALDLTTVRQPHAGKGERAATALLALLGGGAVAPAVTLPTELVVRGSTGGQWFG